MNLKKSAFSTQRNAGNNRGSKHQNGQDSGAREAPEEKSRKKNADTMPREVWKHGCRHDKTHLGALSPYS